MRRFSLSATSRSGKANINKELGGPRRPIMTNSLHANTRACDQVKLATCEASELVASMAARTRTTSSNDGLSMCLRMLIIHSVVRDQATRSLSEMKRTVAEIHVMEGSGTDCEGFDANCCQLMFRGSH